MRVKPVEFVGTRVWHGNPWCVPGSPKTNKTGQGAFEYTTSPPPLFPSSPEDTQLGALLLPLRIAPGKKL